MKTFKINYFKFGGILIALFVVGLVWELIHGVRTPDDVTIVGKVIGIILTVCLVGYVLYVMGVMVWQMITGKNK